MRALAVAALVMLAAASAAAQESRLAAEFRTEGEDIKKNCGSLKKTMSCAVTLVTNHPVHIALGSIAPKNGFGFGPAFSYHFTPDNWRDQWSSDALFAPGGAWRAGSYFTARRTRIEPPRPVTRARRPIVIRDYPVFTMYGQVISLPEIHYYGLGRTAQRPPTAFGMREAIIGGSANVPVGSAVGRALNLSLLGELNGRLFDLRPGSGEPDITTAFTETTAPGLTRQPDFVQPGGGVRLKPSLGNGFVNLSYTFQLQQFVSASDSTYSFRRWIVDLAHEIPLASTSMPPARSDIISPNDCADGPTTAPCPSVTRNRWGTASVRFFASKSQVDAGHAVPFYLQRTLGGSDINGNRVLASYDDYRFRAPHVMFLQESIEHSIFRLPVGIWLSAEQGAVALQTEKLRFSNAIHSYAAGLTLRAGGFPVVIASWAHGPEGNHVAFTMDTSLLGGGNRPSLH